MQTNKKKKAAPVRKPYLKGKPLDNTCIKSIAGVFGGTLALMLGFVIMGGMMTWDIPVLRPAANAMLMFCAYMLFFYSGSTRGTTAVNHGEIMYQRRESGREIDTAELKRSFHPAKGFIIGLAGCVPVVVCGILLACMAQRQMTTAGALPSWVSTLNRPEINHALVAYQQSFSMSMEDILRLVVRMSTMPLVNIIGSDQADALLLMERLSALIMLLPGLSYGLGYMQGTRIRTSVHTNIAEGKRKQAKKAKKALNARKKQTANKPNGPEQLN